MLTFPNLLKNIRLETNLTQEELGGILGVSTVLITMIETGQKQVSRNFIERLAEKLEVHPSSITPFLFMENDLDIRKLSAPERALISVGEKLQDHLIRIKSKKLLRRG